MGKKVIVKYGKVNEIAKVMKLQRETVSRALNYQSNSFTARKVRYVAIKEYGGVEVELKN